MASKQKKLNFYYGNYGAEAAKEKARYGAVVFDSSSRLIYVDQKAFGGSGGGTDVSVVIGDASVGYRDLGKIQRFIEDHEKRITKNREDIDKLTPTPTPTQACKWMEYDAHPYSE